MLSVLADGAWLQGDNGKVLEHVRSLNPASFLCAKSTSIRVTAAAAALPLFNAQSKRLSLRP